MKTLPLSRNHQKMVDRFSSLYLYLWPQPRVQYVLNRTLMINFTAIRLRKYTLFTRSWRPFWPMTQNLSTQWNKHSFQHYNHTFGSLLEWMLW